MASKQACFRKVHIITVIDETFPICVIMNSIKTWSEFIINTADRSECGSTCLQWSSTSEQGREVGLIGIGRHEFPLCKWAA